MKRIVKIRVVIPANEPIRRFAGSLLVNRQYVIDSHRSVEGGEKRADNCRDICGESSLI
jgi:hypothetical protein